MQINEHNPQVQRGAQLPKVRRPVVEKSTERRTEQPLEGTRRASALAGRPKRRLYGAGF